MEDAAFRLSLIRIRDGFLVSRPGGGRAWIRARWAVDPMRAPHRRAPSAHLGSEKSTRPAPFFLRVNRVPLRGGEGSSKPTASETATIAREPRPRGQANPARLGDRAAVWPKGNQLAVHGGAFAAVRGPARPCPAARNHASSLGSMRLPIGCGRSAACGSVRAAMSIGHAGRPGDEENLT